MNFDHPLHLAPTVFPIPHHMYILWPEQPGCRVEEVSFLLQIVFYCLQQGFSHQWGTSQRYPLSFFKTPPPTSSDVSLSFLGVRDIRSSTHIPSTMQSKYKVGFVGRRLIGREKAVWIRSPSSHNPIELTRLDAYTSESVERDPHTYPEATGNCRDFLLPEVTGRLQSTALFFLWVTQS